MGNTKVKFSGQLKKEWKKITWEPKETIFRKTALVAAVAVVLGLVTTAIDAGFLALLEKFVL